MSKVEILMIAVAALAVSVMLTLAVLAAVYLWRMRPDDDGPDAAKAFLSTWRDF